MNKIIRHILTGILAAITIATGMMTLTVATAKSKTEVNK